MEVASWGYGQLVRLLQSNDEDGKMRSQSKVVSKYNVVTEYRNLNLHQAAFTNDVGSAAFALRNGQPYNSVYKGTLPIHAASLAGSRDVLKMLIDAGADVNAARLPKHIGAPKESHIHHHHHHNPPGTTGSTPLHFAAAGGHIQIVSILLSHGADSNKCDKNGQVPATLALHCGFKDIVHLLVNHTMNTSQSPDEAIDALEDKIVREEQSKHRRPSLPSIIEQSSSTIKNSTNSIRRGSRTRRYSHSENLANVLETPSSPLPNAPPTPIEESFNLNRAGETFSSENVNEVAAVNHDSSSNQQHPQHSLRRLVSKQSLASLFSRSRSDAARTQEALSDGGDIEDDSRPRSNSNSSLSPTVEHISAPSSPLKKGNKLPKRRSASSTKANKEETISAVIQDDQPSSSGLPMTLTPLQPPRNRTNTVSTMSSTNTRSSNTRTTATDDSSNTSPTHSGSFVFNVPMNQSQHAREAHADRQQKRRAQVRQQSSTSVLSNATSGSTSVGVGGQQTSPNKAQRPKLVGGPSQRTHSHAQSHAQSHSHSHSHSRFNNLQELPLAEQEERLSSAQAAEMVKKVERELLTLAESGKAPNAIDGRRGSDGSGGSGTSGVSGGSVTSSGGGSIGRGVEQHDLLERLQRYGETLALEREARKREDELAGGSANGSVNGSASVPHASPASVSQPPPSHDELRASVTYGEQPTPTTSSSTPPHSPRTFTRRQSSLQHNKLRQSHNTAKKNQYSVKADLFQNDFDSKIPSPLHLSHTTTNSSTRYSKIFKGIRSKLTH